MKIRTNSARVQPEKNVDECRRQLNKRHLQLKIAAVPA